MAEQTTSSIVVNAEPAAVMSVIADFDSYPQWAQGVKSAEVVKPGPAGRPEQVHFELDASPIKDSYTLSYEWNGDQSVRWTLVEGKMLRAMDGAYELGLPSGAWTTWSREGKTAWSAAFAREAVSGLELMGLVGSADDGRLVRVEVSGRDPETLGREAARGLFARGAAELLDLPGLAADPG